MEVKFYNQPKDIRLADVLRDKLCSGKFKNVWFIAGYVKDDGLEYFRNDFESALNAGATVNLVLGLDRKNTSKNVLESFLLMGCNIRYYLNNDDNDKFETRVFAFEGTDGEDFIYLSATKFSENGFLENKCLVTEIKYVNEEKEFNKFKLNLENGFSGDDFSELNEQRLKELASNGDILARITERKIPRISDLYKVGIADIGGEQYNEEASSTLFSDVLSNVEIDIELPATNSIKVQTTLGEEVEHRIEKKKVLSEENVQKVSKLLKSEDDWDYDDMSTFILQVSSKASSDCEIKIPNSIAKNMNLFFNYPDGFHVVENDKGKLVECFEVVLEVFDNVTKSEQRDESAKICKSDRYTVFSSELFSNLDENDIVRIIKQDTSLYRCEIIHLNTDEYGVWDGFCRTALGKGVSRKFGIV